MAAMAAAAAALLFLLAQQAATQQGLGWERSEERSQHEEIEQG